MDFGAGLVQCQMVTRCSHCFGERLRYTQLTSSFFSINIGLVSPGSVIMKKCWRIFGLSILLTSSAAAAERDVSDLRAVAGILDAYHGAAATGDWSTYFELLRDDGVFLGTDAGERWTREEFRAYAANRSGWVYRPLERNINLTPDGNSAWFDELLDSESYGTARGTGVLIKTAAGWKISQYHLTFPIPNELLRELTTTIREFED